MTLEETTEILLAALEDLKAQDIKVLDVKKLTSITDIMLIASGRSNRQVKALADHIVDTAKANKIKVLGLEGEQQGEWVLIDLGDVIVHIMQPAIRDYYQLEKLWAQAPSESRALST
ncbi:MAG: ribosome silencing factor [Gammaproteobacteria bacterium]